MNLNKISKLRLKDGRAFGELLYGVMGDLVLEDGRTLNDFLCEIFCELWEQGENFSAKNPDCVNDSGWQWDVYLVLIKNGIIEGELSDDGEGIEDFDEKSAINIIKGFIKHQFSK